MELSSSNIFSKESFFNISGNKNTEMISYISGHRNPKKLFIFQDVTFRAQKKKEKKTLKKMSYISGNATF